MRTSRKMLGAFVLSALLIVPALAQRQPFPGGFGMMGKGNPVMLLTNKSVQEELKLTKEQAEKVGQFQEKMFERMKESFTKLQDAKPEERREKFQEMMKATAQDAEKVVKEVLKPEQARRLKQIEMQQAGVTVG